VDEAPKSHRFEVQQLIQMKQWQRENQNQNQHRNQRVLGAQFSLNPPRATGESRDQIISGEHEMEKIETLENIIADRLRVISDLDNKL
jgi:hypothetical protein